MRTLLFSALSALLLCLAAAADDKKDEKIDAKLLVGKWSPKEKKEGASMVLEFTKDGKASFTVSQSDKDFKAEGTYKADGNKLAITISADGKEQKMERTVTKLTDAELVTKDEKGTERAFLRVKDKK